MTSSESEVASQPAGHRLPAMELDDWEGVRGSAEGSGLHIAVVCARFNGQVTGLLLSGALAELERCGVAEADRTVVWVSGAFELPLGAKAVALTGKFDAVICLGAVIRGETTHYDIVAEQSAAGIQAVQLETGLPVVLGVLTTEDIDQALARAGGPVGNKGTEAAMTAIEMANLLRQLQSARPGMANSSAPKKAQ
jgi:6,7-dimethyl-8-ribityllumazine synthase